MRKIINNDANKVLYFFLYTMSIISGTFIKNIFFKPSITILYLNTKYIAVKHARGIKRLNELLFLFLSITNK